MKKVKFGKVKYKLKMRNGYVMMKKLKCGNVEYVLKLRYVHGWYVHVMMKKV